MAHTKELSICRSIQFNFLHSRTKDSQKEMAMIDTLEELQEMQRVSSKISHDDVISMVRAPTEDLVKQELARQEEEDEAIVRYGLDLVW